MPRNITNTFEKILKSYIPDPLIFALILTIVLLIFGTYLTPLKFTQLLVFWGDGFWNLIPFTLQMVIILMNGHIIASTTQIQFILTYISKHITTQNQAVITITILSIISCFLNWGLGLIITGTMCIHIFKRIPNINFKLLIACAYSGFIVWHGGLSGSIPLTIATNNNFTEHIIKKIIPIKSTIFSTFNITALIGLLIILPLLNLYLSTKNSITKINTKQEIYTNKKYNSSKSNNFTPAEKLETSLLFPFIFVIFSLIYISIKITNNNFTININSINFILFFIGFLLHKSPKAFIKAAAEASKKASPIIIQFPFYSGIMGIMTHSNLANIFSEQFINISSSNTFYLLTFYSAGFINIFVPSGGGQWAIQAPIVLNAAQSLNINIPLAAMAVAWGDAWTNLIQPFWALPLLAITGLHLRDIIKSCLINFLVSGIFLSIIFLIF